MWKKRLKAWPALHRNDIAGAAHKISYVQIDFHWRVDKGLSFHILLESLWRSGQSLGVHTDAFALNHDCSRIRS
jgi:hypothetical protein